MGKVKGHRPKHVLIMSHTLQTLSTAAVASMISFFVSQTVWPNAVQASALSLNLQEAKDAVVHPGHPVPGANPGNKDQQEVQASRISDLLSSMLMRITSLWERFLSLFSHRKYSNTENDDLEKRLKDHCEDLLETKCDNLTRYINETLRANNITLHEKFEEKLLAVREQCQTNISSVNATILNSLDHAMSEKYRQLSGDEVGAMSRTLENFSELNQHAKIQYEEQLQTLKREFDNKLLAVQEQCQVTIRSLHMEFEDKLQAVQEQCRTNITSVNSTFFKHQDDARSQHEKCWQIVVEIVVCVCILAAGTVFVVKCVQASQHKPPPTDTSNINLAVVCFRDSDEAMCRKWAEAITESLATTPQLVTHVVNSVEDVGHIPACRAALVFVEPDEREMIIEDERHHIGQGLRRLAVQQLMDSGVTVFVMIFHDKQPVNIKDRQLLNCWLQQAEDHVLLKQLKNKRRLVSFGRDPADFQISHVHAQLATCFSTTRQR